MRRKIILDTDPGVDDAYAIQFLLNADVDILAFTTFVIFTRQIYLFHLGFQETVRPTRVHGIYADCYKSTSDKYQSTLVKWDQ